MKKEEKLTLSEDLISQADGARLRGVSRASINELIKRGRLRTTVIAGRPFISRSELLNLEDLKRGPKRTKKRRR